MKKILIYSVVVLMTLFTSCSDFLDINTDPDLLLEVDPSLVLPSAEAHIAGLVNGNYGILGGLWSQHWTQSHVASQYRLEDSYGLSNSNYNRSWRDLYSDALIDLSLVLKGAEEKGDWNAYLQASSLTAYTYLMLADFYDEIPFSEALKGEEGIDEPIFDTGEAVYDGLIAMLDNALAKDFKAEGNAWLQSDFVFGDLGQDGQINGWIQFANTLKLKIYMRQTKARSNVAEAGIVGLLNENNFLPGGAEMNIFSDAPSQSYPLYETNVRQLNVGSNLRGSHTFISYLIENGDPRIDAYFIAGSGGHAGLDQGDFDALSADVAPDAPDVAVFNPETSFFFFTQEEVSFLLAEAELRFGDPALAKMHYDNGITQSCARHGVDGTSLVEVGGAYEYPNGTFDENLKFIMMQKWTSMVDRGYESFFDQNRTGIPNISDLPANDPNYTPGEYTYSIGGVTSGQFPRRLIFPDRTRRTNSNTPAERPVTDRVWWAE